jgi:CheY-like chemotaxis protein
MNILVVDDDEPSFLLVARKLEREGFTVYPAADALQALAVLDQEPIDAVVTDLRMPFLDGRALVARLRGDPRFRSLPVIVLSAFASDDEFEAVLREGASMMLTKDVPMEQIATILRFAA